MLRLHVSDEVRINLWHSRYRVEDVSMIHTHPWDFKSWVVCGELANIKYEQTEAAGFKDYSWATIKPGPAGGMMETAADIIRLRPVIELVDAGKSYSQRHSEIHQSHPKDGTVTINCRQRVGEDVASVFWEKGREWVSARPRPATGVEVADILEWCLYELDKRSAE